MKPHLYLFFIGLLCSSLLFANDKKPNIILIIADDLGYADLSCFGQKKFTTSRLDEMAANGMRFTQFYTGDSTDAKARAILLTAKNARSLKLKTPTEKLPAMLKDAGYSTGFLGKWAINRNNVDDEFLKTFIDSNGLIDPKSTGFDYVQDSNGKSADQLNQKAIDFISVNKKKPFFLFYAMTDLHKNLEAVKADSSFENKDWPDTEKAFATMVHNLDQNVGKLIDHLKSLKIDNNTLVIFSSDSGPIKAPGHDIEFFNSNGKMRGGQGEIFEGAIRVPTIAYWPGVIKAGSKDESHWHAPDYLVSFAEIAGVTLETDTDGDSFLPILQGTPRKKQWQRQGSMYWQVGDYEATRFGKWKTIRTPIRTGEVVLYDMSNDMGERRNYAKRRPDLARHSKNLLDRFHKPPKPRKKK